MTGPGTGFRSLRPASCVGWLLSLSGGLVMNELIFPDELTPEDRMKAFREHLRSLDELAAIVAPHVCA
jgi:hypothetical protein